MDLHAARVLKHFWAEPLVLLRIVEKSGEIGIVTVGTTNRQPTDQETYKPSQFGREGHVNCIAFEESSPYNFEMERQIYIMIVCVRTKLSRKHNQQKKKRRMKIRQESLQAHTETIPNHSWCEFLTLFSNTKW